MTNSIGWREGRRWGPAVWLCFLFCLLAANANAVPQSLDWDQLTWVPEGRTNLEETYQVDGRDVTVTFSGDTAGLDNMGTLSPRITNIGNNGGLVPPENFLAISTDYPNSVRERQVNVTIDLSAFPGGVENLSLRVFDVDRSGAFVDVVVITAIANGVTIDPTTLTPGPANILISPNTIEGRSLSTPGQDLGNIFVEFAAAGITSIELQYQNGGPTNNAGFQTISLHDLNFGFPVADIRVDKSVDNPTPSATDQVVYTVTVTNDGPDDGTGLVVTDQLPSGLTYVSDDSGGAYDPLTGEWTIGTLANGASTDLMITAVVNAVGDYVNTAELTAATVFDPDSTPGNNDPAEDDQASVTITPTVFADLSLTKTVDDAEPLVGDLITYTVTLTNGGPLDTTGVTVDDALPSGLSYVSDTPSAGTYDAATGIWTVGALANGATETLLIMATVLPNGDYLNVAEVATSDLPDPDSTPGNNDPNEDDQAQVAIAPPAIGAAKSVSAGPVNNGDGTFTLTYDVLATNFGTVPLSDFQITDDLAATFTGATGFIVDAVTSVGYSVNPAYNGVADTNLLLGTDTLGVGDSALIALTVTVTPGANNGPYNNQATASGTGPLGTPVTDDSQLGINPDPDADGDPTNNNDPTPVTFAEGPQIGLAKRVSSAVTNNGDGTFTFDYTFFVQNFGDVLLTNAQVVDRLSDTFAGATAFSVDAINSATLAVNPNYDGTVDINLLAGTDTLPVGGSGDVVLTVTVTPGANLGPYQNTATAAGISPAGTPVSDDSTDGVSADPDNDGDPGNNSTPTPVTFGEAPQIGLAKAVSSAPVNNGDGTFDFTYSVLVQNSGDVTLTEVQVTDDLGGAFSQAVAYTVTAINSPDLAFNPNFDGGGDQNLLLGTDTLLVGASGTITISLTVEPGANLGPYNNTAIGVGTSPAGTVVQDLSTNGVNPDPNNNNDPTDDSTPTPVTFGENPGIGTAKAVVAPPMDNNNGSFTFTYRITLENTGDVNLSDLQVVEDLSATFAAAQNFVVNAIQSADFAVNGAFNGVADTALLAGTDTLNVGANGTVDLTVTVVPGEFAGPYFNTAVGQGTSPSGAPVEDDSTDGTEVDPDNDGNPGNNSNPTPVSFATPMLVVTKSAQPRQVSVGELVRYTVTVENTGGSQFIDLTLVDLIPAGFTYVSGSERLSNGAPLIDGERPVNFSDIDVAAGETITLTYILRVGAGVVAGNYPNVITPTRLGTPVADPATAVVQVIADPDFEQTTIIGKVFADDNENGFQDEGEVGIPGVRLATVEGLLMETDASGRYHIAGVDGGFMERGRNFIVKVDPATLPDGATFTTENPRVKRITQGLMNRFDFGVGLPDNQRDRMYPIHVKLAEVFFVENSAQVRSEFSSALSELATRLVKHGGGTLFIEGNDVADCQVRGPDVLSTRIESESFVFVPNFGIRKATLTPEDQAALADLVERWRGAEDVTLTSIGHTSNVPIALQNQPEFADNYVLGQARAQTVANYLRDELGLQGSQTTVESRGPDDPVASNETFEGRAENRRVELTLTGRRIKQQVLEGSRTPCNPGLAKQRADNVFEVLRGYMGDENIHDVKMMVGKSDSYTP